MSSSPLDLRALEVRLAFGDSLDAAECGALIAALRAHREVLEEAKARLELWQVRMDETPLFFDENDVIGRAAVALASLK